MCSASCGPVWTKILENQPDARPDFPIYLLYHVYEHDLHSLTAKAPKSAHPDQVFFVAAQSARHHNTDAHYCLDCYSMSRIISCAQRTRFLYAICIDDGAGSCLANPDDHSIADACFDTHLSFEHF